jgi:drug/metabolite transporter (DMT)-like permease
LVGQLVASTAILAIKLSTMHPAMLGALRLLVAAQVLMPLYLRDSRRCGRSCRTMLAEARPSFLPGVLLALHFISWNYGARLTFAANANLIVNMMPVAMPFVMYALAGTRISRRELLGTVVAMAGVLVLTGFNVRLGSNTLAGDLLCFVSMLFFVLYIALGTRNNHQATVWLYVVPLYWTAGLFALLLSSGFIMAEGLWQGGVVPAGFDLVIELAYPVYLGLFPTIVGHTIFNRSMQVLPSQVVSIAMLNQFIFAGIFAFLLFGEIPAASFLPAAALMLVGAALSILQPRTGLPTERRI